MEWKTIERPGFFGRHKQRRLEMFDNTHGKGNWRIAWIWGREIVDQEEACKLYETAYYEDALKRRALWESLAATARDVYDHTPDNVRSLRDYGVQERDRPTHLQDIAIRNVLFRLGLEFTGTELVQIRSHAAYWGKELSPGRVAFHRPDFIVPDHVCPSWCDRGSIECFYQDNKVLQVKV